MARYKKPKQIERYWFETYGCQMNIAESEALEMQLRGIGLTEAETCEEADIAIINTCSVRKSAENRVWGRIGNYSRIKSEHPMILVVMGCMAERLKDTLIKDAPQIDYVFGTNDKLKIVDVALGSHKKIESEETYNFLKNYYKEGDVSTFVPIMNGCNNFCTYCIVPYVRGREVSRNLQEVIEEIKFLDSKGVKEITLLGQNVNSYKYTDEAGNEIRFPQLLEKVAQNAGNIEWVRFESPHPKDFSDELIEVIKNEKKVAKHIHLPIQSGNDRILKLMNRRYDSASLKVLIDKIRAADSNITFSTDVMVGFPGESEDEYEDTQIMMNYLRCTEAFMYYWNPREGTPATKMDGQISHEVKLRRLQAIIERQHEIFAVEKTILAKGVHKVLVTKVSRDDKEQYLGRGEHNERVAFSHNDNISIDDIAEVEYLGINGNTVVGRAIK
ncbi:MAG: tRNA (N6-isopentenyl adenosine(37)-C2)-methylthiotransferase MiaB [Spirochaetaceae bacterium]|nr:tRNA (N6-isopentenyl adenosine(37)-C2)-methylthiotransferase MiaB [Spirochaetaceae bacterium]